MNRSEYREKMRKAKYQTKKEGGKWGKKAGNQVQDGLLAMEKLKGIFNGQDIG